MILSSRKQRKGSNQGSARRQKLPTVEGRYSGSAQVKKIYGATRLGKSGPKQKLFHNQELAISTQSVPTTNLSRPTGVSTQLVSPANKDKDKALVVNRGRHRPDTHLDQVRRGVRKQERVNTEEDQVLYSGGEDAYHNDYAQSVAKPARGKALLSHTMSEQRLTRRTNMSVENHRPLRDEKYFSRVVNKEATSLMRLEKLVQR